VWVDRDVVVYECPVRSFTTFVDEVLEWFDATYELAPVGGLAVMWQRAALPVAGGLGEQPAKLIEALGFVANHRNALLVRRGGRK
jgi:hypothetical protein